MRINNPVDYFETHLNLLTFMFKIQNIFHLILSLLFRSPLLKLYSFLYPKDRLNVSTRFTIFSLSPAVMGAVNAM